MPSRASGQRPLTGRVDALRNACVDVELSGPAGHALVTCVVDTGFDGELTLPAAVVAQLRLPLVRATLVTLADGTQIAMSGYRAEATWFGPQRSVLVYGSLTNEALLGSGMLSDRRLVIDYAARTVEIS